MQFSRRLSCLGIAAMLIAGSFAPRADAAGRIYWDTNLTTSSNQGGNGVWNLTNTNWWSDDVATPPGSPPPDYANVVYNPNKYVRFGGNSDPVTAGGTIILEDDVEIRGAAVVSASYTFNGAGRTITMAAGGGNIFTIQTGNTTFNVDIAGSAANGVMISSYANRHLTMNGAVKNVAGSTTTPLKLDIIPGSDVASTTIDLFTGINTYGGSTTVTGRVVSGSSNPNNNGNIQHLIMRLTGSLANSKITLNTYGKLEGTAADHGLLHANLVGDVVDKITVNTNATLDITYLDLDIVATGSQTLGEYVLADYTNGTLLGSQFASLTVNGQSTGWTLDYDGTAANPGNKIVLLIPEPASLGLMMLGALAVLARRR